MKKYLKLLSVGLLAVLMCMCFCSCKELDQMRDEQAFWGKTEETVYFRKAEYRLLPPCRELSLVPGAHGYITDKDVPVLLQSLGQYMSYSKDAEFIVAGHWDYQLGCNKVWCIADLYDEVCRQIENMTLDNVCIYSPKYTDGKCDFSYVLLPKNAYDVINEAIGTNEGIESEAPWKHGTEFENLYFCDSTLRFVDTETLIYVIFDGSDSRVSVETDGGVWLEYPISAENAEMIVGAIYDIRDSIYTTLED